MNAGTLKRWAGWLALVVVFSVACAFLANWQFNRRAEAVDRIQQVISNYDQQPVALDSLANPNGFNAENEWRPVLLEGSFMREQAVLVRNRPYNGLPGFLQLIPFQLESGEIVAVETGWLPTGSKQDSPDVTPLPDSAPRKLVARIRAAEPSLNRDAPAHQIATLNIEALIEKSGLTGTIYKRLYVRAGEKYSNADLPKLLGKPALTEGNHLSYAVQWILFALMAFAALYWAIRKELAARALAKNPTAVVKQKRKKTDADIEDEILG
jgi:cytochrome oxidase assembly protein ShyY1